MPSTSSHRPRAGRVLAVAAAAAIPAACATGVLGITGSRVALPTGMLLATLLTLVGAVVLLRSGASGGRATGYVLTGGVMAAAYGSGQLLLGIQQLTAGGPVGFPTPGDLVSMAAVPAVLATVLLIPRPPGPSGRLAQLVPDALVVSTAGALLVWRAAFMDCAAGSLEEVWAAAVVVAELSVVALLLQIAVTGLDRGTAVFAVGAALIAAADAASIEANLEGAAASPWVSAVLLCLGWPAICAGLLLVRSPGALDETGQVRAEARTAGSTTVLLVLVAVVVAVVVRGGPLDLVSSGLVALLVVLLAVRELAQQRRRVRQVAALSHLAHHDHLTGLGNRRALEAALRRLTGSPGPASTTVLDLDGFKEVNDRLGHSTGDALLAAVAAALAGMCPPGVAAFRTGGDEFVLLGPLDDDDMAALAARVSATVRGAASGVPGAHRVRLSASCGVVGLHLDDPGDPDGAGGRGRELMAPVAQASAAMAAAKRAGRDRVVLYTDDVAAGARRAAAVRRALRGALEREELVVHLQPVVDLATGALHGFEALARWHDEELGEVSPVEFVPVAEESGLVVALGRSALRQGLRALVACGGVRERLTLAVNASPVELRSEGFVADVRAALEQHGVPADLLVVEVTEAVLVSEGDPAVQALTALGELGVTIAVDDFGTGYSSLAYLTRMPVHLLKLDRSLTTAPAGGAGRVIVEAVVRMSRALGIDVVAEGVEEQEQASALVELGVRYGQGWLFSPALPPEQAAALVARARHRVQVASRQ